MAATIRKLINSAQVELYFASKAKVFLCHIEPFTPLMKSLLTPGAIRRIEKNIGILLTKIIDGQGTRALVFEGKAIMEGKLNELAKKLKELLRKYPNNEDLIARLRKLANRLEHLDEYVKARVKFKALSSEALEAMWKSKVKSLHLPKAELKALYLRYLDEYPGLLEGGFNQAEFITKIFKNNKLVEEVVEFSISGRKKEWLKYFGKKPKFPPNTIDILEDYESYTKFMVGAVESGGHSRKFDSELKYIFNFLKTHIHRGDSFIIETRNIFRTCDSCRREFVMLEQYLKKVGKDVKFIVRTDEAITNTKRLKSKLKIK